MLPSYTLYNIVSFVNSVIFSSLDAGVTARHAMTALASLPVLPLVATTGDKSGVLLSLNLVVCHVLPSYIEAYISVPFIITIWSLYVNTEPSSFLISLSLLVHAATAKSPLPASAAWLSP